MYEHLYEAIEKPRLKDMLGEAPQCWSSHITQDLPSASINYMRGRPNCSFRMFEGSAQEVEVPYRGYITVDTSLPEVKQISAIQLQQEPFEQFFRHAYMLQHFGSSDQVKENAEIIYQRVRGEREEFVNMVAPDTIFWLYDNFFAKDSPVDKKKQVLDKQVYATALACLARAGEDPRAQLSKDTVKSLLDESASHAGALSIALFFDNRNRADGNSIDIAGMVKEKIAMVLCDEVPTKDYTKSKEREDLLETLHVAPTLQGETLTYALLQAQGQAHIHTIIDRLAPIIGVETIRKTLREYVLYNDSFRGTFYEVFDYLGLDTGEEIAVDLTRDVYEKSTPKFTEEYTPYTDTLPFELGLLENEMHGKQRILDVGCGTGRVLLPLGELLGKNVTGIDIYDHDLQGIKNKNAQADIKKASWYGMPFRDSSFDVAYCLGRSFMHNTTIPDAIKHLREMGRVIKDDGCIILDLPDANAGDYKAAIEKTKYIADKKKYGEVLRGIIVDSPDGQHYFDRYCPDDEAFTALAQLAGLEAEMIGQQQFGSETADENVNKYWKLTKKEQKGMAYDHNSGRLFDRRSMLLERIKHH